MVARESRSPQQCARLRSEHGGRGARRRPRQLPDELRASGPDPLVRQRSERNQRGTRRHVRDTTSSKRDFNDPNFLSRFVQGELLINPLVRSQQLSDASL